MIIISGSHRITRVITIAPKPPYTITPHLSQFTLRDQPTPCIYDSQARTCRRAVTWGVKEPVAYEARVVREGWDPLIEVQTYAGSERVAERVVRHVLNTDYAYPDVNSLINVCPGLKGILSRHPGLRPALNPSMWESLLKTIIGQQIPTRLANRITAKLTLTLGRKLVKEGKEFYDLPTPNDILSAGTDKLREVGLSRRKAEYVLGIAKAVVREGYDLEAVAKLRPEEAVEELRKFRGVGSWTAKLAYMACTGNLNLLLPEDLSVSRGLKLAGCREELIDGVLPHAGLISYLAANLYESLRPRARVKRASRQS